MFVFSFKTTGKQLCAALCTAALGLSLLAVALFVPDAPAHTVVAAAKTPADQQAFLRSLGYAAAETPLSAEEIKIPENPRDASFVAYNGLQMEGGFNLGLYCGQALKKYAWNVTDDAGNAAVAHLWIYKEKIVGGALTDPTTGKQKALKKLSREE